MTIAIGTHFADGVILCADTKLVDSSGIVSYGGKISAMEAGNGRTFAITHAADDANAATMLANEILDALGNSLEHHQFEPVIKQCMMRWQSDYAQSTVPLVQFLIACGSASHPSLLFCQPPNVVIRKYRQDPIAIGSAVRVVEALLPFVLVQPSGAADPDLIVMDAESTLLKLAYLMRRAKSEDLYAGGDTDTMIVRRDGTWAQTKRAEMKKAEEFSKKLDLYFRWACYGLFSQQSEDDQKAFMRRFSSLYLRDVNEASKMWFPSLEGLGD